MIHCIRILVLLFIAMAILVPVTAAQKPPTPPPTPPSTPPSRSTPPISEPSQPRADLVSFLRGRIATQDGTTVPHDLLVERVCDNKVRQEVYASPHGDFSMQLGSRNDSFFDARDDPNSPNGAATKNPVTGISRRELTRCEIRASAPGFYPSVLSLMEVDALDSNIDVGTIVVQRSTKIEGVTVSAIPYKAPKDARKAYEKGLESERHGKLADAHKYLEKAVESYPGFAVAWFQLGIVLQKQDHKDAARKAYTQATTVDTRFLPPYLSLASMAYQAGNWTEVLRLTGHIMELDPLNNTAATKYILDLDALNYADAYFYNAIANYKLSKFEDAEKSGLKAEHLDLFTHFPQIHLLLAEVFARKNNYAMAISQIRTYLDLAPNAKHTDQVREQLAKLEKQNDAVPTSEKPDQM
jgi:tetratricopeptide (TPR) repeat protein